MLRYSILLALLSLCYGYKILVVFPIPGRSHTILGEGYVRHLVEAGHEVTYVTPRLIQDGPPNLRQIDISENIKYFSPKIFNIKAIMYKELNIQDHIFMMSIMHDFWKKTIELKVMQDFLSDPKEHFDVVIAEWLYTEFGAGIAPVFNCPLIWSSSMDPHSFVLSLVHEHLNPSYVVDHMSLDYSFSFWHRVNQLWTISRAIYYKWSNTAKANEDFRRAYGPSLTKRGLPIPDYEAVIYNASLMLGNSDIVVGDGIALPQNYKHVGGYHIKDTIDPLPKDLQEIMDNAKHGVIYFSMGSNLRSVDIPDKIKIGLLQVFSGLKQTVIWKLEQVIPNVPKNVHISPWAPQPSILAHPNCVLFVTHGGLLSILETLRVGLPIIGIPFFADQYMNTNRVVAKGYGKRIDFNDNSPNELKEAIKEILEDPSYRERAKELSKAFNDRIVPPGKELVHWVEHVVKTKGASHLRSSALHVSWYRKIYLDLLCIVILAIVLLVAVVKYLLKMFKINIMKDKKKLS